MQYSKSGWMVVVLLASGAVFGQNPRPQNPNNEAWWRTPQAERVGVSPEQRKKLEDLTQQHRLRRIDLEAAVQKAQVTLEPLWQADSPDEGKILGQIDRLTQAQAEVRKDEARLQLGVRQILSVEQWKRLQELQRPNPGNPQQGFGPGQQGPNGPPSPQGQPPRPPQQPQR